MNMYAQMVMNLGFVILLIVGYFYTMHYLNKRKYKSGRQIELLETMSLGSKEKIILIKAKGQTLLIGVTQNNISMLTDFDNAGMMGESIKPAEIQQMLAKEEV